MSNRERDLNTVGDSRSSAASQVEAAHRLGETADEHELKALLAIASSAVLEPPVASAVGTALAVGCRRLRVTLDSQLADLQDETFDAYDEAMAQGCEPS